MMKSMAVLLASVLYVKQTSGVESAMFLKKEPCTIPICFSSFEASSKIICADACLESQDCEAFSYSKQNNECLLHEAPFTDNGCVTSSKHYIKKSKSCLNGGYYDLSIHMCHCNGGYVGDLCDRLMEDCSEGMLYPYYKDMQQVFPIKPLLSPSPFSVLCWMKWTGRTYVQQRTNEATLFEKSWLEYKSGFGTLAHFGDFWLGNENVYYITNSRRYRLQLQLWNNNHRRMIFINGFRIGNETDNFKLEFDSIQNSTNPNRYLGDCFEPLLNASFSTNDQDNDEDSGVDCGALHRSGWWFRGPDCAVCNPNGHMTSNKFRPGKPEDAYWTPTLGNRAINRMVMSLAIMEDDE